jgi:hypothetical protein
MALILELEDLQGRRTRHRLDGLPVTIGRSCASDLVVDDPYVDATHARLTHGPAGAIVVCDLGSVNGIVADAGRQQEVVLRPGTAVRLGRTWLRVRDPQEVLPPAIPDTLRPPVAHGPTAGREPARPDAAQPVPALVPQGAPARLAVVLVTLGAVALYGWLHAWERSSAGTALALVLAVLLGSGIWAGIWAVASRATVQRFQFSGHVTVACGVVLVTLAEHVTSEWIDFFAPDAFLYTPLSWVGALVVVAVAVAAHLSLSSTMPARRRWRAGGIVAGVILAVVGLSALAQDESFTDVPTFSAILKPVPVQWLPTATVDDFGDVMRQLKEDVDARAALARRMDRSIP